MLKRLYLFITLLIITCFSLPVFAEEIGEINEDNFTDSQATKLIYGEKHVFTVNVPANWINDSTAEQDSGIPFLIKPDNDEDWNKVYLYAIGFDKPENSNEDIKTFVKNDTKNYKNNYPGIKINKIDINFDNIKNSTTLSGKYYINEFSNFDNTYKEIVVYIEFTQGVGTIVFSTTSKEVFEKYYNDFISLVNSFHFIADSFNMIDINKE